MFQRREQRKSLKISCDKNSCIVFERDVHDWQNNKKAKDDIECAIVLAQGAIMARTAPIWLITRATIAKIDPASISTRLSSRIVVMPITTPMMPMIRVITGKPFLNKDTCWFEPIFSTRRASRHTAESIEKIQANATNARAASSLEHVVVPLAGDDKQSISPQTKPIVVNTHPRYKPDLKTVTPYAFVLPLKERCETSDASWTGKTGQVIPSNSTSRLDWKPDEKSRVTTY